MITQPHSSAMGTSEPTSCLLDKRYWFLLSTLQSTNICHFTYILVKAHCLSCFNPLRATGKFQNSAFFSCSLDHSFSSTHSTLPIQDFLERSPREEENEVDHDSQHTIYPALERSDSTENAPNASNCVPLQIFHFTRSWSSNFFAVYS